MFETGVAPTADLTFQKKPSNNNHRSQWRELNPAFVRADERTPRGVSAPDRCFTGSTAENGETHGRHPRALRSQPRESHPRGRGYGPRRCLARAAKPTVEQDPWRELHPRRRFERPESLLLEDTDRINNEGSGSGSGSGSTRKAAESHHIPCGTIRAIYLRTAVRRCCAPHVRGACDIGARAPASSPSRNRERTKTTDKCRRRSGTRAPSRVRTPPSLLLRAARPSGVRGVYSSGHAMSSPSPRAFTRSSRTAFPLARSVTRVRYLWTVIVTENRRLSARRKRERGIGWNRTNHHPINNRPLAPAQLRSQIPVGCPTGSGRRPRLHSAVS